MNLAGCFKKGLLRRTRPSGKEAMKSLATSEYYLGMAQLNLDSDAHPVCVFCSYTAMFHAARAVLIFDGVKEHSHVCIGLYLKETYPELTGVARTLDIYRLSRHNMLYALEVKASAKHARQALYEARNLVDVISRFLHERKNKR